MKPFGSLARGIRMALARPHLLFVLALVDLALALVAVAPSYAALDESLSHRIESPALARGFDFVAWLDLRASSPEALFGWPYALAAALALAWVWGSVSAAGWLSSAARQGFWAGLGRLGFRFLRLAVIVAVLLVALELGRAALAARVSPWADASASEWIARAAMLGVEALHGFAILVVLAISDVAKARIAEYDRRSALGAFFSAMWFVVRRPFSTAAVAVTGAALQGALLWGAGTATDATLAPTQAGFWIPLGLGQVAIALRIAVRAGTLLAFARLSERDLALRLGATELGDADILEM